MGRRFAALVGLLAGLIVACDATVAPVSSPTSWHAESRDFVLQASIPKLQWSSADEIVVTTTLTWTGAAPTVQVGTSTDGPVEFSLNQLDGTLEMAGAHDLVCATKTFARGVATPVPFAKSGGWTADDPNASFYERFYRDPRLILPPGHWRLSIATEGFVGPCDPNTPRMDVALPPIDLLVLPVP